MFVTTPGIPFDQLSHETPYAGDQIANYEEAFDDLLAQDIPDEQQFAKDPRFHHNLAMYLDEVTLNTIGNELTDRIRKDSDDRQRWIDIIAEGIDYLGIGGKASKTSTSSRNTDIYSATMMTLALRITSKIHTTLFPAKDFIETQIRGLINDDMEDRSMRIREFFNYFLTDVAEEYKPDKKQAFWWMVLEGSVFSKVYEDKVKERPSAPYVRAENLIINSAASSLDDADRITHEFFITEREYQLKVEAGEYKDTDLEMADLYDNKLKQKQDQKVGQSSIPDDDTKVFQLHECLCYLNIKGFEHLDKDGKPSGKPLPYILTKDKNSNTIIGLYRNWNEEDLKFRMKNPYVQYKYFTGFNVYGLGLIHLMLGYAKAETELQQQLLKSAQLANAPVLLQASGMRNERTQLEIKPGAINQFNSFGQDFNNNVKPLGFHDPSPIMLDLKKMLSDGMEQISIARQINPDNIPQNTSATTMLGVLSTMHILEDSLMNDLYTAFKKELGLLYNLFGQWLPDEPYPFAVEGGEHAVMREDFMPAIAIRPTLDPNASSTTFQLIVNDTINTMAQQAPDLYNLKEIHKRMLKSMKVSDYDALFKPEEGPPPPPPALDPITESQTAMMGQPIKAYPFQDHQAYIIVHQHTVAQLTADESQDHSQSISILQANIQERQAMMYVAEMEARIGQPLPEDPSQTPPEVQNEIAMKAAQVILQEKQEQEARNPPPIDPSQVMLEEARIKEKGMDLKAQLDEKKAALEEMKMQEQARIEQMKMQLEVERLKLERMRLEAEHQTKLAQIEVERQKAELQSQTHAYDSSLKHEAEQQKADLQAEGKAYDSTLKYEADLQTKEEEKINENKST